MDRHAVEYFKNWFFLYVRSFACKDQKIQRNIDLKEQHTYRVCKEAVSIGTDLGMSEPDLWLAETAALFHDVGRFEQFRLYKTFSDIRSVNHAEFGAEILKEKKVLDILEDPLPELVTKIVSLHNRAQLPETENETCLFFTRLIRDADKLDIFRLVIDYYDRKATCGKNETIELELPDTPGVSSEVSKNLVQGKPVLYEHMKNMNDFKLLQAGWVYDINFLPALSRLKQRGYLDLLKELIPQSDIVKEIFNSIEEYVNRKLSCDAVTDKQI